MSSKRKIIFLTGTRADFGKIKSLIKSVEDSKNLEAYVFVTGMHLLEKFGYTLIEIERCGFKHIHTFNNATSEKTMDLTLAKTIEGFSDYIKKIQPDLIVVHGDRVEALAGAVTGSLNNILVAHIEGGEVSGTVDELIRHAVSKLSHIHFVANETAKKRLMQMGEIPESIFVIGSPDIDIMLSDQLPGIDEVKKYYEIPFAHYAVVLFHPVTTEIDQTEKQAEKFVNALIRSGKNYVVIYPNNDLGSEKILNQYQKLDGLKNFRIIPSMRFEYFLTLLKHADFVIGNSSAGIREAPYYGTPSINIGTRQNKRGNAPTILHTDFDEDGILEAIEKASQLNHPEGHNEFGDGTATEKFIKTLKNPDIWKIPKQKIFRDIN